MTQKQKPKLNWTYAGNDRSKRYVGGCEQQPGKTFTQSSKSQAYRGCCRLRELERSHQPTTAPSELYSRWKNQQISKLIIRKILKGRYTGESGAFETKKRALCRQSYNGHGIPFPQSKPISPDSTSPESAGVTHFTYSPSFNLVSELIYAFRIFGTFLPGSFLCPLLATPMRV